MLRKILFFALPATLLAAVVAACSGGSNLPNIATTSQQGNVATRIGAPKPDDGDVTDSCSAVATRGTVHAADCTDLGDDSVDPVGDGAGFPDGGSSDTSDTGGGGSGGGTNYNTQQEDVCNNAGGLYVSAQGASVVACSNKGSVTASNVNNCGYNVTVGPPNLLGIGNFSVVKGSTVVISGTTDFGVRVGLDCDIIIGG